MTARLRNINVTGTYLSINALEKMHDGGDEKVSLFLAIETEEQCKFVVHHLRDAANQIERAGGH